MEKKFRYFIAVPITDVETNHIGYHLKRLRDFLDVKQCAVIAHTAQCPSTISDIERHRKNPKFYTIQNYIKALGANPCQSTPYSSKCALYFQLDGGFGCGFSNPTTPVPYSTNLPYFLPFP